MNQLEAVRLINNSIFRPGWKISAMPVPASTHIVLTFLLRTVDTSLPTHAGEYVTPMTIQPSRLVDVSALERQDLFYEVLHLVSVIQQHEDREFFRVRTLEGSWEAPLHPHRLDGELAWDSAEIRAGREAVRHLPAERLAALGLSA